MNHPEERLWQLLTDSKREAQGANRPYGKGEVLGVLRGFLLEYAAEVKRGAQKERKRAKIVDGAEEVYQAYPRHEGGVDALAKISAAIAQDGLPIVLAKTKEYAAAVAQWPRLYRYSTEGRDLVPMPATWFHQRRYLDDSRAWVRQGGKPAPEVKQSLPEPLNWRQSVPEFVRVKEPWGRLSHDDQTFITRICETGAGFAGIPREEAEATRLRQA